MASTLPPAQAPIKEDYGGDEINALVLDAGSYSIRAGFAGEDTPKSVVPSYYGVTPSDERMYGENAVHLPRGDMEIKNPYNADGVVEDWETASKLWEHSITSRLTGTRQTPPSKNGLNDAPAKDGEGDVPMEEDLEKLEEDQDRPLAEYPLLMSEPGWNTTKSRERTIEIAMEEWGVPAFFLAKSGQLAAYGNGKATALVVDVGHQNTSVTAIWEGMVLRKSLMHSPLAGKFLSDQIRIMFANMQPAVPLIPHYMVKSKAPVDAGAPSAATYMKYAQPPSDSFRRLEEDRILTSFKESVVQAWSGPGRLDSNVDAVRMSPPRPFEMPDGWNQVFGVERYRVAEGYFDTKSAYTDAEHYTPKTDDSIPSLVHRALNNCDVDTRAALLGNVILTGAGSLIDKLPERLQGDLQIMYPNPKVRIIANPSSVERKYGAWIGGSVLASLGTFHQMWISKEEYKEYGPSLVEKRCK
ncbi:Actin-related protein 4 [Elasticomyces elasticus]|nr:Actin-related protein 4 [Elasticomyces elasticus]KAK5744675.1 Actin-related protein 4 [Elasticomyces elasticus]